MQIHQLMITSKHSHQRQYQIRSQPTVHRCSPAEIWLVLGWPDIESCNKMVTSTAKHIAHIWKNKQTNKQTNLLNLLSSPGEVMHWSINICLIVYAIDSTQCFPMRLNLHCQPQAFPAPYLSFRVLHYAGCDHSIQVIYSLASAK